MEVDNGGICAIVETWFVFVLLEVGGISIMICVGDNRSDDLFVMESVPVDAFEETVLLDIQRAITKIA